MKKFSRAYLYARYVIICIQKVNKNNTRSKFQSERTYVLLQGLINGTGRKQSQTSSTGKVKDWRETNITINWIFVLYNFDVTWSKSLYLNYSWKPIILIKFLVFIRALGSIETCLFVGSFSIVVPTAVSSFHPYTVRLIFIHCMERVRIIRS